MPQSNWLRDHLHYFVYPTICSFDGMDQDTYNRDKEYERIARTVLESEDGTELIQNEVYKSLPVYCNCKSCHMNKYPSGTCKCDMSKFTTVCKLNPLNTYKPRPQRPTEKQIAYRLIYDSLEAMEYKIGVSQKLILTGRDTWQLYIGAMKRKRLRSRTLYIPQINRAVSQSQLGVDLLKRKGANISDLYVDTGYVGTIFNNLRALGFRIDPSNVLLLSTTSDTYKTLFKKNKYRGEVEIIETSPKYYESAELGRTWNPIIRRYTDDKIKQNLNSKKEVIKCALLTKMIWRGL